MPDKPRKTRKKRQAQTLPISPVRVKTLGFECEDLTEADAQAGLPVSLSGLITKHKALAEAWTRGQFLRSLKHIAGTMTTTQEAAEWLTDAGYGQYRSAKALEDALEADHEYQSMWNTTRLAMRVATHQGLFKAACEGSHWAIKWADVYCREELAKGGGQDWNLVTLKQLVAMCGRTLETVGQWRKSSGMPWVGSGYYVKVDLLKWVPWFEQFLSRKIQTGRTAPVVNPMHAQKAKKLELEYKEQLGEMVSDREFIATLCACLQKVVAAFSDIPGLANVMYGQEREQIVRSLEDLRDQLIGHLQVMPECLQLGPDAQEALRKFYDALVADRAGKIEQEVKK
jgi:hypothetical protein